MSNVPTFPIMGKSNQEEGQAATATEVQLPSAVPSPTRTEPYLSPSKSGMESARQSPGKHSATYLSPARAGGKRGASRSPGKEADLSPGSQHTVERKVSRPRGQTGSLLSLGPPPSIVTAGQTLEVYGHNGEPVVVRVKENFLDGELRIPDGEGYPPPDGLPEAFQVDGNQYGIKFPHPVKDCDVLFFQHQGHVHRVQADEAKEAWETFLLLEVATVEVSDNEDEQDTEGLPEAVPVSGAPGEWELTYPCDIERGQVLKFVLDGHVRRITAGISAQAGHTITLCCNDGGSEGGGSEEWEKLQDEQDEKGDSQPDKEEAAGGDVDSGEEFAEIASILLAEHEDELKEKQEKEKAAFQHKERAVRHMWESVMCEVNKVTKAHSELQTLYAESIRIASLITGCINSMNRKVNKMAAEEGCSALATPAQAMGIHFQELWDAASNLMGKVESRAAEIKRGLAFYQTLHVDNHLWVKRIQDPVHFVKVKCEISQSMKHLKIEQLGSQEVTQAQAEVDAGMMYLHQQITTVKCNTGRAQAFWVATDSIRSQGWRHITSLVRCMAEIAQAEDKVRGGMEQTCKVLLTASLKC